MLNVKNRKGIKLVKRTLLLGVTGRIQDKSRMVDMSQGAADMEEESQEMRQLILLVCVTGRIQDVMTQQNQMGRLLVGVTGRIQDIVYQVMLRKMLLVCVTGRNQGVHRTERLRKPFVMVTTRELLVLESTAGRGQDKLGLMMELS